MKTKILLIGLIIFLVNVISVNARETIKSCGFSVPKIISKNAIIKSNVKIGDGAFIQSGTIISSGVTIEKSLAS